MNPAISHNLPEDPGLVALVGGVIALLVLATLIGTALRRRVRGEAAVATVANLNARIRAWWVMVGVFLTLLLVGRDGTLVLFGALSFLALREFISLMPTRLADHRALFWVFFVLTPLQYWSIHVAWYGLFIALIPVLAFLVIPSRIVATGDGVDFLSRTANLQWALMVCVYCVSHAPAILMLEIPGFVGQNAKLLFYFVLLVQLSDVLQYVWGKLLGRRAISPTISPNKTWEGFWGGLLCTTGIGAALHWATPFSPGAAALIALAACFFGFLGGLTMSAIKRGFGVKDYGTLIEGHGGVLDRLDSVCFAAPIFFHITRYFYTTIPGL